LRRSAENVLVSPWEIEPTMINRFAFALSFALCVLTVAATAQADAFLKLDSIPGESSDKAHKDEITVDSFTFGSSSSSSLTSGAASAGKVQFDVLSFSHHVDRASAALLLAVARGTVLKSAVLTARKGGSTHDFIKVTLSDVLVTSVKIVGDDDDGAREEVTLRFGKITFEYFNVADGKSTPAGKMGWDIVTNKAL
jgi:type VI secretion system secreted protein Hcp